MYVLASMRCDRVAPVFVRRLQPLAASASTCNRSHYDALGITPKATQADVKAAYYRLTKQYHPDKQQAAGAGGDDHTDKFRQVTEAYEVLGNVKLRRLYDKGMHHHVAAGAGAQQARATAAAEDDPAMRFYRSREARSRPPPPSPLRADNVPIYDFDAWSKHHYGRTLEREQMIRQRQQQRAAYEERARHTVRSERILFVMLGALTAIILMSHELADEDQPTYKRESDVSTRHSRAAPHKT